MTALVACDLNDQQRELVRLIVVEGKPPEDAAKLAGYHPKSVYRHCGSPRSRPRSRNRSRWI